MSDAHRTCSGVWTCAEGQGVGFQLWFPFIDWNLTGVLILSDTLSVIDGQIMQAAAKNDPKG